MDYQRLDVILIGNATHDAERREAAEGGSSYGDFRLAVRDRHDQTTYFPVRCFGKLAESVAHIRKGTRLFVVGQLEISAFDGEDGARRMTFRVVADTYRILGRRNGTPTAPAAQP